MRVDSVGALCCVRDMKECGGGVAGTVPAVCLAEGALGGGGFFGLCRHTDTQSSESLSAGKCFCSLSFSSRQTRGSHLLLHFQKLDKVVGEDALPAPDLTHPPAGVRTLLETRSGSRDSQRSSRRRRPRPGESADLGDDVDDFALFDRQLVLILRLVRKEHFALLPAA